MREGHDLHLLIAGSDDGMEAHCRTMVKQEGLADRTTFTGLLVKDAKRIVLGGADVLILPSMTENFGIAVAEAAASGAPLLISDQVNIGPVFGRENAAIIVPPELAKVTDGLRRLISYPVQAKAMATRARVVAERHLSWNSIADDLASMYRSAVIANERKSARASPHQAASHPF